jgi:hypothetical protein
MNGFKGIIRCETDANPPITYITWKKDSRLFDPFSNAGMMALLNGSLLIDQVSVYLYLAIFAIFGYIWLFSAIFGYFWLFSAIFGFFHNHHTELSLGFQNRGCYQ